MSMPIPPWEKRLPLESGELQMKIIRKCWNALQAMRKKAREKGQEHKKYLKEYG